MAEVVVPGNSYSTFTQVRDWIVNTASSPAPAPTPVTSAPSTPVVASAPSFHTNYGKRIQECSQFVWKRQHNCHCGGCFGDWSICCRWNRILLHAYTKSVMFRFVVVVSLSCCVHRAVLLSLSFLYALPLYAIF